MDNESFFKMPKVLFTDEYHKLTDVTHVGCFAHLDGIENSEKPCIFKDFLALCCTRFYQTGATPKRKAAGSNPVRDASALSRKIFHEIFRVSSNKKEASLMKC